MPRLKSSARPPQRHLTVFCKPEYLCHLREIWGRQPEHGAFGTWLVRQAEISAAERRRLLRLGEDAPPFELPEGFDYLKCPSRNDRLSVRVSKSALECLREVWLHDRRDWRETRGFGSWVAWQAVTQTAKAWLSGLSKG